METNGDGYKQWWTENSGSPGATMRDWGNYNDHGDQWRCKERTENSGRLGETVRDWGDYRNHGDQWR